MMTRVDRSFDEPTDFIPKRVAKNRNLYDEMKNTDLDNFDIASNAKVIGDNNSQIDIDKIKEILEKNYQAPQRRSLKMDIPEDEEYVMEKTREYDINSILEAARQEKEVDYEEERLKKVRDTQYDILKNLELEASEKETTKKNKEELLELINTINLNEVQNKAKERMEEEALEEEETETEELNPLNILSDLKGDENTVVAGAKEFNEEMASLEEEKAKKEKEEISEAIDEDVDESFYTNSMSFSKKDFADFDDIDEGGSGIFVKILIVFLVLAIISGIVLFLNEFLNLGLF
mgnify:FL=1|uniref:hypothetical protein n=1 Tax=Candidatus Ventrenecus sp. TaxID=3085654 RepID=UPI004024D229